MATFLETAITVGIKVLEGMFILGALGSVLVLILTTIDDAKVLFSSDEKPLAASSSDRSVNTFPAKQAVVHSR